MKILALIALLPTICFGQFDKLEALGLEKLSYSPDTARIIGYQALKAAKNNAEKAVAYKLIALSHDFQGDFENSHNFAFKALALVPSKTPDRPSLKADIVNDISCTWFEKSQMDSANRWFTIAMNEYRLIKDTLGMINSEYNIAGIRIRWGETSYPVEVYTRAGEYYLKHKEYVRYAMTLKDLGILFFDNEDFDKALTYFNKALPIFQKHKDLVGIGQTYDGIASVLKRKGQCEKAIPLYEKFIAICKEIGNVDYIQGAYENIGSCYVDLNQPDKALVAYDLVRKDIEAKENWLLLNKLYRGISSTYRLKKAYQTALDYSKKAIDIAAANNYQYDLRDSYKLHSENLSSLGLFKEATIALIQLDTLNRVLFNQDKDATIKSTEARFNMKLSEAKNLELQEKNKIAALELRNEKNTRGNIIVGLVAAALIGLAGLTLYGRTRALNKKLEVINADKDKLFRIVSHDLRSPLVVLRNRLENSQQDELLIDNTLLVMDNLLNWSLSQTSGITPNPKQIDLLAIVGDTIHEQHQLLKQKNITVNNTVDDSAIAWADENMTTVCFRNLLHNAVKFTEVGGAIEIKAIKEGNQTHLIISNAVLNGNGVEHGKSTIGTGGEKGSGVGLKIVSELAKLNSGEFKIVQRDKVIEASLTLPERKPY